MAKESTKQGGRGGRKLAMVIGLGLHAEGQQLFSGVADTHGKKILLKQVKRPWQMKTKKN